MTEENDQLNTEIQEILNRIICELEFESERELEYYSSSSNASLIRDALFQNFPSFSANNNNVISEKQRKQKERNRLNRLKQKEMKKSKYIKNKNDILSSLENLGQNSPKKSAKTAKRQKDIRKEKGFTIRDARLEKSLIELNEFYSKKDLCEYLVIFKQNCFQRRDQRNLHSVKILSEKLTLGNSENDKSQESAYMTIKSKNILHFF